MHTTHHSLSNLDSYPTRVELNDSGAAGVQGAAERAACLAGAVSRPPLGEVVAVLQLKVAVGHQRAAMQGEL